MNLRKLFPFIGKFAPIRRPEFTPSLELERRQERAAAELPNNSILPVLRQKAQREALLKRETVRMALAELKRAEQ